MKEIYTKCIEILEKIDPLTNTKILFERQSLYFRAKFLKIRS